MKEVSSRPSVEIYHKLLFFFSITNAIKTRKHHKHHYHDQVPSWGRTTRSVSWSTKAGQPPPPLGRVSMCSSSGEAFRHHIRESTHPRGFLNPLIPLPKSSISSWSSPETLRRSGPLRPSRLVATRDPSTAESVAERQERSDERYDNSERPVCSCCVETEVGHSRECNPPWRRRNSDVT